MSRVVLALVVSLSLGVVGCASQPTDNTTEGLPPTSSGPAEPAPAATAPAPAESSTAAPEVAETPESAVGTPQPFTYEDKNAQLAERYDIEDPPDVEIVRIVEPEEWAATVAECLREDGINAWVENNGGLTVESRVEQTETVNLSNYICMVKYPVDIRYEQPYTKEQSRRIYDFRLEETLPCLRAEGYDVADPPTFETFWAGHDGRRGYDWDPIGDADPTYSTRCPDFPDHLSLFD